jgi:hypothetical protein
MALNYKSGTETQAALTATTNGNTIDLIGYKELALSTKLATCTGTSNTATLVLQTSNDNSVWHDHFTLASETDAVDFDSDSYFQYLPDNSQSNEFGFGRYIRFRLAASGTFSVSYTIKWLAKE